MVIDVRDRLWKLFWIFIINHIFLNVRYETSYGTMVEYSTKKLKVVGSNPTTDTLFSSQIVVFMQNLGLILVTKS